MDGARASSEHAFQLYTVKGDGMAAVALARLVLHAVWLMGLCVCCCCCCCGSGGHVWCCMCYWLQLFELLHDLFELLS